jgi:hypothetical protein
VHGVNTTYGRYEVNAKKEDAWEQAFFHRSH